MELFFDEINNYPGSDYGIVLNSANADSSSTLCTESRYVCPSTHHSSFPGCYECIKMFVIRLLSDSSHCIPYSSISLIPRKSPEIFI